MIGFVLLGLGVAVALGSGGSTTKQVSVVGPIDTPSEPSNEPKPNVGACALGYAYYPEHKGTSAECQARHVAPGYVAADVWIPRNQYNAQSHPDDATHWVAVDFEYNDNYSDGEAAVLATIAKAYNAPEIYGMKPSDWSSRTKALVAMVFNHPRNQPQLGRAGTLRFKNTIKGWTLQGASVAKRYAPQPMTLDEAQTQSSSHQRYPTIYLPPE